MNIPFTIPGLDSYRGRYLYLTTLALLLLTVFAYSSWNEISQASKLTRQHIIERRENSNLLNVIISQFQLTKVEIYKYSLMPNSFEQFQISRSVSRLLEITEKVDIMVFDDIDSNLLNNVIIQIPVQLLYRTIDLIEIRSDTSLWMPATKIMSEQLSPLNQQVITTLNTILSDEDVANSDSKDVLSQFLVIKNMWLSTISEFRLLTANRFGIFDPSEEGLSIRQQNLHILIAQLDINLDVLEQNLPSSEYGFIREFLLPELRNNIRRWVNKHKQAIELLMQEYWRQDILALQHIEQLLSQFNRSIVLLQNELAKQSNRDIESLNKINQSLSFYFILLCLLGLLTATLFYLFFYQNILRPIAKTTRALFLQSQGMSSELVISSKTSETRELINAFNYMSEQIKQRENRLDFMAHHDALTNLPNRLLFNERLEHAVKFTDRSHKQLALMLLDLDRFKLINDTLGHLFGDKLLQQTATRLKNCMRAEDTIARLGGDEFAIILENISGTSEVDIFAKKIIQLFNNPFFIDDQEIHVSTSIGIALAPLNSRDPTTLIRYADIAMYQSKNMGRNQYTWFQDSLENTEESIINFENQLREAITGHQFELHFQPLVDINDSSFIASEALLRWRHPQRGLLYPDKFISILDNSGLLFDLTCWVIRESQKFQSLVEKKYQLIPRISINLHSMVFQQKHYRDRIKSILLKEIKHPEKYVLEITEDTLITDINNTSITLDALHDHGFSIALDDFGTGQSSLSHLRAFPIDIIKIDQEFIRAVHIEVHDANLVKAILSLGHDLNMQVIAEGVEQPDQLQFITNNGCHLIQGYLFSKPMTADGYLDYIQKQIATPKTAI